jgi:hypothetical protein
MDHGNERSYEQLIKFLETWTSFDGDEEVYDTIGILTIFRACLTNLHLRSIQGDFEDLHEVFDENEIEVMRKIIAGFDAGKAAGQ